MDTLPFMMKNEDRHRLHLHLQLLGQSHARDRGHCRPRLWPPLHRPQDQPSPMGQTSLIIFTLFFLHLFFFFFFFFSFFTSHLVFFFLFSVLYRRTLLGKVECSSSFPRHRNKLLHPSPLPPHHPFSSRPSSLSFQRIADARDRSQARPRPLAVSLVEERDFWVTSPVGE